MPQIQDCKRELRKMFQLNPETLPAYVEVQAGELHERVFGESAESTPVCCAAMRSELREGDCVLTGSHEEHGGAFTVRYALPRPSPVVPGDAVD